MNVMRINLIGQVLYSSADFRFRCTVISFALTNSPRFWEASFLPLLPTEVVMDSCIMQLCKITLIFLNATFAVSHDP